MHLLHSSLRKSPFTRFIVVAALALLVPSLAHGEARLLIEADSGKVLEAENATMPWYPASVTKLMTAYVTLKAVKDGKITLDTQITVSPTAASQSPSKMGFRPGIQLTVDNALKMMLVKSANDMAVVLAEGVGGSIDGFSAMMNQTAQKLGMTQTSYVNPNGLPADGQITSARDLAILARAIIKDLPEYEYFVHIPSIRYGRRVTQNFNKLIGRYPGADGFKTGFICASGYNLVASATRDGKRLIAVVLGASSGTMRAVRAAQMLDRGFGTNGLGWLKPSLGTVDQLAPIDASPPNLRDEMCSGKRHHPASDEDDTTASDSTSGAQIGSTFLAAGLQQPARQACGPDGRRARAVGAYSRLYRTDAHRCGADRSGRRRYREPDGAPRQEGPRRRQEARRNSGAQGRQQEAPRATPSRRRRCATPTPPRRLRTSPRRRTRPQRSPPSPRPRQSPRPALAATPPTRNPRAPPADGMCR